MTCASLQLFLGCQTKDVEFGGASITCGRKVCTKFLYENLKERDRSIDGSIIPE